jgi:hypothetical protein
MEEARREKKAARALTRMLAVMSHPVGKGPTGFTPCSPQVSVQAVAE